MKGTRALILGGVMVMTLLLCFSLPSDTTWDAERGGGEVMSLRTP